LGPSLGAKAKFLSFNRTQSKFVTGLLTGHNTLRRYLHLLGQLDSPLCRGVEWKRKPRLTFFVIVMPWPHSDIGIWAPFFGSPKILGAIWKFSKATGLPWFVMGHKGPVK
jgi:hypothetical protein